MRKHLDQHLHGIHPIYPYQRRPKADLGKAFGRVLPFSDFILSLQISCGIVSEPGMNPVADVDGKVGLVEAVFGM